MPIQGGGERGNRVYVILGSVRLCHLSERRRRQRKSRAPVPVSGRETEKGRSAPLRGKERDGTGREMGCGVRCQWNKRGEGMEGNVMDPKIPFNWVNSAHEFKSQL